MTPAIILSQGQLLQFNRERTCLTKIDVDKSSSEITQLVTSATTMVALAKNGQAYRLVGNQFVQLGSQISSLTLLGETVYGINYDGYLVWWNGQKFELIPGLEDLTAVCSDHQDNLFVLTCKGQVRGFHPHTHVVTEVPGHYQAIHSWPHYSGVIYLTNHKGRVYLRAASQPETLTLIQAERQLVAQDYTYHLVGNKVIYCIDNGQWQYLDTDGWTRDLAVIGNDICLIGDNYYLIKEAFGDVSFRFHPGNQKNYPPISPIKIPVIL